MNPDGVAQALITLHDDDDACSRLAGGDFTPISGVELTDEEKSIVREVAAERGAEVSGFSLQSPSMVKTFDYFQANKITVPTLRTNLQTRVSAISAASIPADQSCDVY